MKAPFIAIFGLWGSPLLLDRTALTSLLVVMARQFYGPALMGKMKKDQDSRLLINLPDIQQA